MAGYPHRCVQARRPAAGFTLMEVLLAITMVSFIMVAIYWTLFAAIKTRDLVEKEGLKSKVGPYIMDLIERDLSGIWCMNIHENDVFLGEAHTINGVPADTIHMVTTTDSTIVEESGEEPVRSDLTEVSYRIRENPVNPEFFELYRRQDFHVDDKIAEGGRYELLYSRIRSFQVLYYKDLFEGADKLDKWDAKARNRLPAAVEISMSLELDPRLVGYEQENIDTRLLEYHRIIFPPGGSELTMAVRPVIPTYVEPEEEPATGTGGGGQGTDAPKEDEKGELNIGEGDVTSEFGVVNGDGELPDLPPPPDFPKDPPTLPPDMNIEDLLDLLDGIK